jgi:hypothetical protein
VRRGAFLWPAGLDVPPVRRRGEGTPRDPKLICPEELGRAAVLTLRAQYGMSFEDLLRQTAYALGYGSLGARVEEALRRAVGVEIRDGRILVTEERLLQAREDAD